MGSLLRASAANGDRSGVYGPAGRVRRYAVPVLALGVASMLAGFEVARLHGSARWTGASLVEASSLTGAQSHSTSDASPSLAASPSADTLSQLAPQEQAERLLERAIARDTESLETIRKSVDGWRGYLQNTDRLFDLVHTALNSEDLRVRSSALEIDLAANNLSKSPQSVALLVQQLRNDPADRSSVLWRLGALGNRGVQPKIVLAQLLNYVHDRNEETRYWAVEGLAVLGTDGAIDPLLDRFAHDPSAKVRKRAGCNLAKSGMLTKQQRLAAVPELLNAFDDDAIDATTRGWVYGALRLITGAELGNDANAWRKWWANRNTAAHRHHIDHSGILHA
jgi:HEAT repeat protein